MKSERFHQPWKSLYQYLRSTTHPVRVTNEFFFSGFTTKNGSWSWWWRWHPSVGGKVKSNPLGFNANICHCLKKLSISHHKNLSIPFPHHLFNIYLPAKDYYHLPNTSPTTHQDTFTSRRLERVILRDLGGIFLQPISSRLVNLPPAGHVSLPRNGRPYDQGFMKTIGFP